MKHAANILLAGLAAVGIVSLLQQWRPAEPSKRLSCAGKIVMRAGPLGLRAAQAEASK